MSTIVNDNILNPGRFFRLFYLDFRKDLRGFFITLGGVFAFFMLVSLLNGYMGRTEDHLDTYMIMFMVGGIILSSRSFRYYYMRDRNTPLLMLPASKLEKWLEILLMNTIGWAAASFIGFSVYTFVSAGLNELLFGFHTSPVWWSSVLGKFYLHYLVVHSVFFLGSSVFRKNAFFKTILTGFIIMVVLGLISALFVRILFGDLYSVVFELSQGGGVQIGPQDFTPEVQSFVERFGQIIQVFYWALIPYCWIVSFVRFTEIEVKDGV